MTTLLIATRNEHKTQEIRAILSERFKYLNFRHFAGAPEVVEDAATFPGNATKKAVELAQWIAPRLSSHPEIEFPLYVLADDSGLEVDALQGAPGVYSARFAALGTDKMGNSSDAENNEKLLGLLQQVPPESRSARFRCVLALTPVFAPQAQNASPVCAAIEAEFQTELFEGTCEGRIELKASGKNGFGYDPLFTPVGKKQTFAELGDSEKNQLSHRAQALGKLRLRLESFSKH